MTHELDRVGWALDALPVASDAAFQRVVTMGKLRCAVQDGTPDLIDELSARLVCSALRVPPGASILIVFPDDVERRAPLLFASALIMDAHGSIEAGKAGRVVLYVSSDAGIRSQIASVRLGTLSLDGVFAQQYGRRTTDGMRTLALPGGAHLPGVLCISSPADPEDLLDTYKPKWVAVDCGAGRESGWLPGLLGEARRRGVSVVGWTTNPFTEGVSQWLEAGGGLFRWPRLRRDAAGRRLSLKELSEGTLRVEVTPRILTGENVLGISQALVSATEALLAARDCRDGQLSADAVALGWSYLRTLESLPVPLDVWERQASCYWGTRSVSELQTAFTRFIVAVSGVSQKLHAILQEAAEALALAQQKLAGTESPLWLGLANLCVESAGQRRIVFSSRARQEMFSFCLLSRFNISEDDLREVGVHLDYLSQAPDRSAAFSAPDVHNTVPDESPPLLVGVPGRFGERYLDALMGSGQLEVLLWPHQERVLEGRVRSLARSLRFSCQHLTWLLPSLNRAEQKDQLEVLEQQPTLRLGRASTAPAGPFGTELRRKAEAVTLWKRLDVSEVVASLFELAGTVEEDAVYAAPGLVDESAIEQQIPETPEDLWVQDALEIGFQDGLCVVFPTDEVVNVIVHGPRGTEVEQRYVRSLRAGDEILFIQGQRRQSLYELLVSRVHRDPVIGQYLALVRRWQDDLVRAFFGAERQSGVTAERLLRELQDKGSALTSPDTIRGWLRRRVLSPNDAEDLRRIAEVLSLRFVLDYYLQIHRAGRRLKGLHISLSARLNRWLASSAAGAMTAGGAEEVIDAELDLTMEDFRHSLVRLQVRDVTPQRGPFFRPQMGHLYGG